MNVYRAVLKQALDEMAAHAEQAMQEAGRPCEGWLPWFRLHHPELYAKYAAAEKKISELWGSADMAAFKQAVKNLQDGCKWAITQFTEYRQQMPSPASVTDTEPTIGPVIITIVLDEKITIEEAANRREKREREALCRS
ncbi:MAG: hypothetical protein IT388_00615 [Nitrospirales bacterium]|nr:hypothetical protein [Nitrospirales bacterium]